MDGILWLGRFCLVEKCLRSAERQAGTENYSGFELLEVSRRIDWRQTGVFDIRLDFLRGGIKDIIHWSTPCEPGLLRQTIMNIQ